MSTQKKPLPMKVTLDSTQINDLARPLKVIVEAFYQNPENEKKFQEWLVQKESDARK